MIAEGENQAKNENRDRLGNRVGVSKIKKVKIYFRFFDDLRFLKKTRFLFWAIIFVFFFYFFVLWPNQALFF